MTSFIKTKLQKALLNIEENKQNNTSEQNFDLFRK